MYVLDFSSDLCPKKITFQFLFGYFYHSSGVFAKIQRLFPASFCDLQTKKIDSICVILIGIYLYTCILYIYKKVDLNTGLPK